MCHLNVHVADYCVVYPGTIITVYHAQVHLLLTQTTLSMSAV